MRRRNSIRKRKVFPPFHTRYCNFRHQSHNVARSYALFMVGLWSRPFATLLRRCASFSIAQILTVVLAIERDHCTFVHFLRFLLRFPFFENRCRTLWKNKIHKATSLSIFSLQIIYFSQKLSFSPQNIFLKMLISSDFFSDFSTNDWFFEKCRLWKASTESCRDSMSAPGTPTICRRRVKKPAEVRN